MKRIAALLAAFGLGGIASWLERRGSAQPERIIREVDFVHLRVNDAFGPQVLELTLGLKDGSSLSSYVDLPVCSGSIESTEN